MKISPSHTHLLLLKKKRAIYSHSTYLQLWVLEALVKKLSHLWIILALRDELRCDHQKHCYCGYSSSHWSFMKGPNVKLTAQSLHQLTAWSQTLPITPAWGSFFCGNLLWKFCLCPEQRNLPCQNQGPGEVLSTAERNVEMCSAGGGIALGRHYTWCSMEENGGKLLRKSLKCCFLSGCLWVFFWSRVVIWEGTSPLQAAAHEESTIYHDNHHCFIPFTRRNMVLSWQFSLLLVLYN